MKVEVGAVTVVMEKGDDPEGFIRSLFRFMNNKEVSEMLGVSPRTVGRWKQEGLLPCRGTGQVMLLDLVNLQRSGSNGPIAPGQGAPRTRPRPEKNRESKGRRGRTAARSTRGEHEGKEATTPGNHSLRQRSPRAGPWSPQEEGP